MASDDLKKRIEAMNRGPLPTPPESKQGDVEEIRRKLRRMAERQKPEPPTPSTPPQHPTAGRDAIVYRRDLPQHPAPRIRPRAAGRHVTLADAVQGEEITAPNGEIAFLVEHRVDDLDAPKDRARPVCEAFHAALTDAQSNLRAHLATVKTLNETLDPNRILFFDLETTGLGSTPLFLVGAMMWEDGGLVVRQYLARTYAEERAVISLFAEAIAQRGQLVSFNGKSYDLPYVRTRAAATGMRFADPPTHVDLLHVSRRIWKKRLPDCRLQTLEAFICGRVRRGDIPGHEIPDAYHAFVRTGNASEMVVILHHNMLDLITLADLMTRFPPVPEQK